MLGRSRNAAMRIACAFMLALLTPAAAHAGLTTPPVAVDNSLDSQFAAPDGVALHVGAADGGDGVAAWRDEGGAPTPIKLLLWRAGAVAPELVSPGLGSDPDVAMAPDGHAVATWTGSDGRLRIMRREPGGGWLAPALVDPPPLGGADSSRWGAPAVALRRDGSAVVAVPGCLDYGISAENFAYAVDVAADGSIGGAQQAADTSYSTMGCFSPGVTRAAAGPGGQAAMTFCIDLSCRLATRTDAGAAWVAYGVDGSQYGNYAAGAVPVISPTGKVIVTWRSENPAPTRVRAAIGTTATAMTQLYDLSDASVDSTAAEPFAFGDDVLALFQTAAAGGGVQVLARPIFAAGSYGPFNVLADRSFAGDPHGAAWPDGSGVIAFASQPRADAGASLTLVRRSLGGTLSPIDVTALPGRSVALPRIALAGNAAQPLGLVATREAPVGGSGSPATIVLRRIDGIPPSLSLAVPASAEIGTPVGFTASVSDVSAPISVAWSFGDGTSAQGAAVSHAYATSGPRTVTATATDPAGNVTTATASIQVADHVKPTIGRAALTATRFRVGRQRTALVARRRAPVGTTLRVTLSEPANLQIAVVKARAGRRVHGRCRVGAHRGRRCVRRTTLRTLRRQLAAGSAAIPFSGRIGRRALAPGRYELRLVAVDAAGNRSAATTLRFTIVR